MRSSGGRTAKISVAMYYRGVLSGGDVSGARLAWGGSTFMNSASSSASLVSVSRAMLGGEGWGIAVLRFDFVFLRLPFSGLGLGALLAMRGEARQSRRME